MDLRRGGALVRAPSCIRLRLRTLRIAQGWTQAQLATAAGCSRECISQIEQHKIHPSLLLATRLAGALALDHVDDLLEPGGGGGGHPRTRAS
jgi:putative transcriptional regulator